MKTVLITGASTGIGRSAAEYLASRGWQVFAGIRKEQDGAALIAANARIKPILLDVTNPEQVDAAVETIRAALGGQKLAGLVNNAGIANMGPLALQPLPCCYMEDYGMLSSPSRKFFSVVCGI